MKAQTVPDTRGLVPAIHVLAAPRKQDVDARHKAGHDVPKCSTITLMSAPPG